MIAENKGKAKILIDDTVVSPVPPANPVVGEGQPSAGSSQVSSPAVSSVDLAAMTAIISSAERNVDERSIKVKPPRKREATTNKTFGIKLSNCQRMEKMRSEYGGDFSWQVNAALEYWFLQKYPDITPDEIVYVDTNRRA